MSKKLYKATTALMSSHFGLVTEASEPFSLTPQEEARLVPKGWVVAVTPEPENPKVTIPEGDLEVLIPSVEVSHSDVEKTEEPVFSTIREEKEPVTEPEVDIIVKEAQPEIKTKEEKKTTKSKQK